MHGARRLVLFSVLPASLLASLLSAAPLARASTGTTPVAPTVVIESPLDGATVEGTVLVTADGAADPDYGDYGVAMGLFADGLEVADVECPDYGICTTTFRWDTTGLTGRHTLTVGYESGLSFALSAPVTAPTVTFSGPAPGASVSGLVTVAATGQVGPGAADTARRMVLLVDGTPTGPIVSCAAASSCSGTWTWRAYGLVGTHNLQVHFSTDTANVLSANLPVTVGPVATKLWLDGLKYLVPGSSATVRGMLVSANTQNPMGNATIQVVFTPARGTAVTISARTDGSGVFTVKYPSPVTVKTFVTATAGPAYSSTASTMAIGVVTPVSCRFPARIKHRTNVTVHCNAGLVADGTKFFLHDADLGVHVLATTKVSHGKATLTFSVPKKRASLVRFWATTGASKLYSESSSREYAVRVT